VILSAEISAREGLSRSVVVASTSDRPALERVTAAVGGQDYRRIFSRSGAHVTFSNGLGNPLLHGPKRDRVGCWRASFGQGGYTPSVFALFGAFPGSAPVLPAGAALPGFYSVLVDGDDFNEPDHRCYPEHPRRAYRPFAGDSLHKTTIRRLISCAATAG